MLFCYLIFSIIILGGGLFFAKHLIYFVRILTTKRISARIIDIANQGWNHGLIIYYYEINLGGEIIRVKGPQNIPINPFEGFFLNSKIGNIVYIKYDSKRNMVLPNSLTVFFYMILGLFMIGMGMAAFFLFLFIF